MSADPFSWRLGARRSLDVSKTRVMGILNVTPDSFHDGGLWTDESAAVAHGLDMVSRGASLIDVGGESTRPGAASVDPEEQVRRTRGVIAGLRAATDAVISIDTTRAVVAEAALAAGADLINDVSAGQEDPAILEVAARHGCGLVLMHRVRPPREDSWSDRYEREPEFGPAGVVESVLDHLHDRIDAARSAGVDRRAIALDPGFGFGKSVDQNLELLAGLSRFVATGQPVLVGISRKSFVGAVTGGGGTEDRLPGSLAAASLAAQAGAAVVRAHDVRETVEAVGLAVATRLVHGAG